MVVGDKGFYSHRRFLLIAVLVGSAILAACGGAPPTGAPNSGANQSCVPIQQMIAKDNSQIKLLQQQKANTTNKAKIAQINTEIAGLQQSIANLQQQRKQLACP